MVLQLTEISSLRNAVQQWRAAGERIALVPTMGALHAGHLQLVSEAKKHAARVVVSIFVNPTQFGPNEDFSRYPRTLAADLEQLTSVGADAVWLPAVEEMYPDGFATNIRITGLRDMLDGVFRPGHFDGVATVVAKLFNQVTPDIALFGEKDYQQLCLIKRLVRDLNMDINIISVPTVRESDGLALSSRNRYLTPTERQQAAQLPKILREAAAAIRAGLPVSVVTAEAEDALDDAGFRTVDYIALHVEDTLAPLAHYTPPARLLAAAWLGNTRLIDNVRV